MVTPVASPCTGVCTLDADDVCAGCLRTLDEIARWGVAGEAERRTMLRTLAERTRNARRR